MINAIRRAIDKKGRLPLGAHLIAPWADLYEAGLTPFAAIQVMIEIEKEFSIEFPDSMLNRESLASINSLFERLRKLSSLHPSFPNFVTLQTRSGSSWPLSAGPKRLHWRRYR
jgi:hypothetical protein